jgi:oligopeptide transport system substrate-binding protein
MRRCAALLLALACGTAGAAPQVLRIGNGIEPESLDPHRAEGVSAGNIVRDLFEGLTAVAPRGGVIPGAAESWDVSADGRVWTFHLRPTARWSNGDAVTAEDFVAGLRRSADPATGSSTSQILAPIANAAEVIAGRVPARQLGVAALDERTLRIALRQPAPWFAGVLAHPSTFPVHRPSLAKFGAQFARPGQLVSNGAYRLAEWAVQSHVTLERNASYWNDAATRIDRVVYLPTEDVGSELKRYRAGELDVTASIPLAQAPWVRANFGPQLHVATYLGTYFYGFNVTRPPFAGNAALRQALAMAIDRDVIAQKVMNGVAAPAWTFVPPGTAQYGAPLPAWAAWPREQRLAEARRLYALAGYSAVRPLDTEIRYNTNEDHKRIAVVVAAMWKQFLGVHVALVNEEFKAFLHDRKLRRATQVYRASWTGDYDDASTFLDLLRSDHGKNDSGWSDADYDRLTGEAAAEPDAAGRRELLAQAEARLLDQAPITPIYFYVSKHLVAPRVRGWQDNVLDYHYAKDLQLAP